MTATERAYLVLIREGKRTLAQVPIKHRKAVEDALEGKKEEFNS